MAKDYRVNVYADEMDREYVVARVRYNAALDQWDGRNWTNGGVGMHKGITKLKDGRYVIIVGTQWQGQKDYGYVVSDNEALQEILKSGNSELLDTKKYSDLKRLLDKMETEDDSYEYPEEEE